MATADRLVDAFKAALASDPISAFGGVIASNQPVDGETAAALGDLFVECIAAPAFTDEAKAISGEAQELPPRRDARSQDRSRLRTALDQSRLVEARHRHG